MLGLREWLTSLGLERYHDALVRQRIDLDIVAELSEDDLAALGMPMGDRKRLLRGVAALRQAAAAAPVVPAGPAGPATGRPPGLAEPHHLLFDHDEEVRQLTLMFADLVGSTTLAKRLGLEDYRDAIRTYQSCCSEVIGSHFGYVAQFLGDGVVAYFGYPHAEEDDAERAVAAALEVTREVARLRLPDVGTMAARVGVATGDVLISDLIGERMSIRGAVLGDTPNLAARLQALAEPGTVVLSAATRALLGRNFDCRSLGTREIKGFAEPQEVWLARGMEVSPSRFSSRRRGTTTPFVGREEEQQMLRSRWRTAVSGEGQVVMISGEAGIGKSRLGEWLSDEIAGEPHYRLSYQCSPYHTGSPLYPVVMQLQHAAGLRADDPAPVRLDKLEATLARGADDVAAVAPLFARLLSIPFEDRYGPLDQPPEVIRERTATALVDQVLGLATRHPVLILFEDLHWVDPTTVEALDLLIDRIRDSRVLMIATFRPEYEAPWSGRGGVTGLPLSRLDRRRSISMVRRIAGTEELPGRLVEEIVEKTEGVPLFLEELTKTVVERRRIDKADGNGLALPSTLKDLLMAKLDSLSSARELVPVCAALGRSFPYPLLLAVAGLAETAIRPILDQLIHAQILLRRGLYPNVTLTFRHALIQEAAYETMLQSRARALHARIAEVLRETFPDIAAARPEVVAQHLSRAGRAAEARDQWRAAASHAIARSASVEACVHLEQALAEHARVEDDPDPTATETALREMLREPLELCGWGSDRIEQNLRRLFELRERQGDLEELFSVVRGSCLTHILAGKIGRAREQAEQMGVIAGKSGNPVHAALHVHHLAMCTFLAGELADAIRQFDEEIAMLTPALAPGVRQYYPADLDIVARVMQAWAMTLLGDHAAAGRRMAEAEALIEAQEQAFSKVYGITILASIHQTRDEPEETLRLVGPSRELAHEARVPYWESWAAIVEGWAQVAARSDARGLDAIRDGLEQYTRTGARQMLPYGRTLLADALHRLGRPEAALKEIEAVEAEASEVRYYDGERAKLTERLRGDAPPMA